MADEEKVVLSDEDLEKAAGVYSETLSELRQHIFFCIILFCFQS